MSNAGKGKPNRVPPMRNGPEPQPRIPDDLVWDEDNPPKVYPCSQDVIHHPQCDGSDELTALDSESQVNLMNEGRAWARANMSFVGIPAAYQNTIPVPGIKIELLDMMIWLQAMKEVVAELSGMSEFDFDEKFREHKIAFLREVREANEANVRRQRVADRLGVVQRPGLLGPHGEPLG